MFLNTLKLKQVNSTSLYLVLWFIIPSSQKYKDVTVDMYHFTNKYIYSILFKSLHRFCSTTDGILKNKSIYKLICFQRKESASHLFTKLVHCF